MHHCAAWEVQQRLPVLAFGVRRPVEPILVHGVLNALGEVCLELDGRGRQAVQEEDEVDAVLVRRRIADLPHDAETVRRVAPDNVCVHGERRAELRERKLLLEADHLDAMPQDIERAPVVKLPAHAVEQNIGRK
jgi:hypothetical protein